MFFNRQNWTERGLINDQLLTLLFYLFTDNLRGGSSPFNRLRSSIRSAESPQPAPILLCLKPSLFPTASTVIQKHSRDCRSVPGGVPFMLYPAVNQSHTALIPNVLKTYFSYFYSMFITWDFCIYFAAVKIKSANLYSHKKPSDFIKNIFKSPKTIALKI